MNAIAERSRAFHLRVWLSLKMTAPRFHSRCGENISLSDNNTVARRVGGIENSIVFTEQPVALDTVFQVKILEYDTRWFGSIVSLV